MLVTILRQTDAVLDGERKALFSGQAYDLPADVASAIIDAGDAVAVKAVEAAPADKAVHKRTTKGRRASR